MSVFLDQFLGNYLPLKEAPFYSNLEEIFCSKKIQDLSIHCPNVIRCIEEILSFDGKEITKDDKDISGREAGRKLADVGHIIRKCLEISDNVSMDKTLDILRIADLYHDIGKIIRPANHPRLGINILRNLDETERTKMVDALAMENDKDSKSNENRFSLLCSIVEHHDKFGVVSTGEGSLAIFSDILYFRSDEKSIDGIKKNITSVMVLNLADIAAVCTANVDIQKRAAELVSAILINGTPVNSTDYGELFKIWKDRDSFLGLSCDKVTNILEDWQELINATEDRNVLGNRTKLREYLLRLDQNPDRTIKRIIRIIKECCHTTGCNSLNLCISETDVESTLISIFGSHQFQDFCIKFAYVAKMDYGLKFFKGIVCACARRKITAQTEKGTWQKLSKSEQDELRRQPEEEKQAILKKVSKIFIQVISGIILRYNSMLELKIESG
jgi:hypothetical protein